MLVSVRPTDRARRDQGELVVLGRSAEDIDEFIEKLEATGAFEHVLPRQQDRTEDGLQRRGRRGLHAGRRAGQAGAVRAAGHEARDREAWDNEVRDNEACDDNACSGRRRVPRRRRRRRGSMTLPRRIFEEKRAADLPGGRRRCC